jgi:cbb3-type cytochrome oxidase subunit 3
MDDVASSRGGSQDYNLTEEGCPEEHVGWPDEWPAFNRACGIVLVLVHTIVLILCLAYMYERRKKEPYRSRNVVLITLSAIGTQCVVLGLSGREAIGRDLWPCDATLWFSYMAGFLWLSPVVRKFLIASP